MHAKARQAAHENAQVAEGISAMLSSNLNHRQSLIFCCWTCPSTFTLAGDDSEDLTSALRVSQRRASAALQDEDEEEIVVRPVKLQVVRKPVPDQNTVLPRYSGGWRYSTGRRLQALLFAHYIRSAADFAGALVFAVSFALSPLAGSVCMYVIVFVYVYI